MSSSLNRRLGLADSVVVGLGAMLGAGVFVAIAPATRVARSGVLIALAVAAVVAYCNATSSARLAARYPQSGGTYVYGRERLGPFWGYLAGWSFVVGKTASCAAIAVTVAQYAWPEHRRLLALLVALAVTALNVAGLRKSTLVTRVLVGVVLLVLGVVVVSCFAGGSISLDRLRPFPDTNLHGVLQAAGLLFFAFAGYARVATLGEEVRDPARTIPRAVRIALGTTLVTYALVFVSALMAAGPGPIAASTAPLRTAVEAGSWSAVAPVVRIGAVLGAAGSLLALVLGVSRTTLAMARDGYLPRPLTIIRRDTPVGAELVVGAVVAGLAATLDLRNAIGFSSFGVLLYYAIANASAWSLGRARVIPTVGLIGCVALAADLPGRDVLAGLAVTALGIAVFAATTRLRHPVNL